MALLNNNYCCNNLLLEKNVHLQTCFKSSENIDVSTKSQNPSTTYYLLLISY